jgi:hypothetical protein
LAFYQRSGFRAFQRQIEVADNPRLDGTAPRDACSGCSSCPDLIRASIGLHKTLAKEMDGRVKPGHDELYRSGEPAPR